jgi:hypothetical protein
MTCGDFVGTGGGDAGSVGGGTGSSSSASSSSAGGVNSTGGASSTGSSSSSATGGDPATGGSLGIGGVLLETGGVFTTGGDMNTGGIVATGGVATGGAPTCVPACSNEKPVCNLGDLTCVQCTGEEHCASVVGKTHCEAATKACVECTKEEECAGNALGKTRCKSGTNECVQCTGDGDCSGIAPFCDLSKNTCVECLESKHCKSPGASLCFAGRCSPCAVNSDCSHLAGKGVCTPKVEPDAGGETSECVQCTGNDYDACSKGDAGPVNICDSLNNTCSELTEHSTKECQPCVSDAQCQPGQLCVNEVFEYGTPSGLVKKSVGYFCFNRQDTMPQNDCTTDPPYVKAVTATSIDGQTAFVCSLLKSTCTAMNRFRQTDCLSKTTNTADDSICGVVAGIDSKCVQYGTTQYRCTVPCLSDDDCPTNNPGCDMSTHFCKLL